MHFPTKLLLILSLFFCSLHYNYGQANAILLSPDKVDDVGAVLKIYAKKGDKPITFSQLKDSLTSVKIEMERVVNTKKQSVSTVFSNYKMVNRVLNDMHKIETCSDHKKCIASYSFYVDFLTYSLYCIEKQDWSNWVYFLKRFSPSKDHKNFQTFILPQMPGHEKAAVRWMVDMLFLRGIYLDSRKKDDPKILVAIRLLDSLWTQYQDPALQKALKVNELQIPYTNGAKQKDTLGLYFSPNEKNLLYNEAATHLLQKYSILALHFENLKKVKNGYILPLNRFLKEPIQTGRSPYLRALQLCQQLLNNGYQIDDREKLQLAYLEATDTAHYCQRAEALLLDNINSRYSAGYLDSLGSPLPAYYLMLKTHHEKLSADCKGYLKSNAQKLLSAIMTMEDQEMAYLLIIQNKGLMFIHTEREWKALVAKQIDNCIDYLMSQKDYQSALLTMMRHRYSFKTQKRKDWDALMQTQITKTLDQLLVEKNDSILLQHSIEILPILDEYLSPEAFLYATKQIAAVLPNIDSKLFLDYKAAIELSHAYRSNKNSQCMQLLAWKRVLQYYENSDIDSSAFHINNYKIDTKLSIFTKAWTSMEIALNNIYSDYSDNYTFDPETFEVIYNATETIPNIAGKKAVPLNCVGDSLNSSIPSLIQNDPALLDRDVFLAKQLKSSDNYILLLSYTLQRTLKNPLLEDFDLLLEWETKRIDFLSKYIAYESEAAYNAQRYAELEKLRINYDTSKAVYWIYDAMIKIQKDSSAQYVPAYPSTSEFRWNRRKAIDLRNTYSKTHPKGRYIGHQDLFPTTSLGLEYPSVVAPERPFQILVHASNIDTFHISIRMFYMKDTLLVRTNYFWDAETFEKIEYLDSIRTELKAYRDEPAIHLAIPYTKDKDFHKHSLELLLPALNTGQYEISVADKADQSNALQTIEVEVSPIWVLGRRLEPKAWEKRRSSYSNWLRHYYLLDRNTGVPLQNIEVLYRKLEPRYDHNGNFINYSLYDDAPVFSTFFKSTESGIKLGSKDRIYKLVYQGDTIGFLRDFKDAPYLEEKENLHCDIFTDRAVYRNGQELKFKVVVFNAKEGIPTVDEDFYGQIGLYNFKGELIKSQSVSTNYFGSADGVFSLSEDLIGGTYYLSCAGQRKNIQIEAYKRPTFEISVRPDNNAYVLGDSICFEASVKALAGYPIQDAAVKYQLELDLTASWYEIRLDQFVDYDDNGNPITRFPSHLSKDYGQMLSDSAGQFKLCFQASPVDYHVPSMQYQYTLKVDISDQKGETQSAEFNKSLRKEAYSIQFDNEEMMDAANKAPINIAVRNSSDAPALVNMNVTLYRLKAAKHFKDYRFWKDPTDTLISAAELEKQLPYSTHWKQDDRSLPYENIIKTITLTAQSDYSLILPKDLPEGKYRIEVAVEDSSGRKASQYSNFSYIDWQTTEMPWAQAFLAHSPKSSYRQDESFNIYLGSSYPEGASMLLYINRLDSIMYQGWQNIKGKKLIEVALEGMPLGDYSYQVYMVLNNRVYEQSGNFNIIAQKPAGKLNIEILSYKKKYEPGDEVEIKLRITDVNNKVVRPETTELVATIYDAALEKFAKHSLRFSDLSHLRSFPLMSMRGDMRLHYEQQVEVRKSASFNRVDTIITFDPETFEEPVQVVENEAKPTSLADLLDNKPKPGKPKKKKQNMLRTDLDETILWAPYEMIYEDDGTITIVTTMNDALTKWNALFAVHSLDGNFGNTELSFVSNKPLMVQPNIPRFARQNDTMVLAAMLVNQSEKNLKGKLKLTILDANTKAPLDGFLLESSIQKFKIKAKKNQGFEWKLVIPDTAKTVLYRIEAKSGKIGDGEEGQFVILTDKGIEIYQEQIRLKGKEQKTMTLPTAQSSKSLPVQLKLNVSYNLTWDVLQSLPSLIENPYDCSEQLINKVYANALSSYILDENPAVASTIKDWKTSGRPLPIELSDPALKEKIKMQSPWLFDLGDADYDKKRFARLLDSTDIQARRLQATDKLRSRQTQSGGLSWYGGDYADNYITMYVLQVLGHYHKLTGKNLLADATYFVKRSFVYSKKEFSKQYNTWKAIAEIAQADLDKLDIRPEHLNFLYTASFYKDVEDSSFAKVQHFIFDLLEKQWQSFKHPISLGHIALSFHRDGRTAIANTVLDSLLQRSFVDDENGRYWLKDYGYYWYESPIETQALLIEAFAEIRPEDKALLEQLKTWLLLQREGGRWATSKATSAAATALMLGGNWLAQNNLPDILLNAQAISFSEEELKRNPGKLAKTWQDSATLASTKSISIKNNNETPAYANLSLYTLKPLSEIVATGDSTFSVKKQLYKALPNGSWQLLNSDSSYSLKRGDRIRVDLDLRVPKYLEYVHLYDQHPAGFEAVNTRSDMFYQGTVHYRDVRDALTNFFFGRLFPGTHRISREFFVNNAGTYQSGIATMECMYAPKFKAHTGSALLHVD